MQVAFVYADGDSPAIRRAVEVLSQCYEVVDYADDPFHRPGVEEIWIVDGIPSWPIEHADVMVFPVDEIRPSQILGWAEELLKQIGLD